MIQLTMASSGSLLFFLTLFVFGHTQSQDIPQQIFEEYAVQPVEQPSFQDDSLELEDNCLGCICDAASNCNRNLGCFDGMCGMFRITQPYWIDGGRNVLSGDDPNSPDAWSRCVKDQVCGAQTVRGYLARYRQDCNGDERITCDDYAMIHHLGGYGCGTRNLDRVYQNNYEFCKKSLNLVEFKG